MDMTLPTNQPLDRDDRWTAQTVGMGVEILDRMERAVAKVRDRLLRATAALNPAAFKTLAVMMMTNSATKTRRREFAFTSSLFEIHDQ